MFLINHLKIPRTIQTNTSETKIKKKSNIINILEQQMYQHSWILNKMMVWNVVSWILIQNDNTLYLQPINQSMKNVALRYYGTQLSLLSWSWPVWLQELRTSRIPGHMLEIDRAWVRRTTKQAAKTSHKLYHHLWALFGTTIFALQTTWPHLLSFRKSETTAS